jgi:hypothetical protein
MYWALLLRTMIFEKHFCCVVTAGDVLSVLGNSVEKRMKLNAARGCSFSANVARRGDDNRVVMNCLLVLDYFKVPQKTSVII